ncbi:MAG: AAA+ family ATPase, partial [Roseiflexus sp.]
RAIGDGVAHLAWETDTFAYAEAYDERTGRYRGLIAGQRITLTPDSHGLVVKPDVARRQMDTEAHAAPSRTGYDPGGAGSMAEYGSEGAIAPPSTKLRETPDQANPVFRRFHGVVSLDPNRVGRDAGQIAQELIAHLVAHGADVQIMLAIDAHFPDGVPDDLRRIVTENSRALRVQGGFEQE